MITLSKKAITASRALDYFRSDFADAKTEYYTEAERVRGEWHGELAARWGLSGPVEEEQFIRFCHDQHPLTGEQLIQVQQARTYTKADGTEVKTQGHRSGWDCVIAAPKSISVTALVGGDERVREAHSLSAAIALDAMQQYVQARIGGDALPETTGKWIVAMFPHDTARPAGDADHSAPHLHNHGLFGNMTQTADGTMRSLQTLEIYAAQQYGTAVYRSEIAARVQKLGYEIEVRDGVPEIKGYTREYIEACSPRSTEVKKNLEEHGRSGARAAHKAVQCTRKTKQLLSREEALAQHLGIAARYGNQPQNVVAEAAHRKGVEFQPKQAMQAARLAISYARDNSMERTAVEDERNLMRDALKHSIGKARMPDVRRAFEESVAAGELIEVKRDLGKAGRLFVTPEMRALERELIERMHAGQDNREVLASGKSRALALAKHPKLNESQRDAVQQVLMSRSQVVGLNGFAGTGKTTTPEAINDALVREGYKVIGLAPTSGAVQKLAEKGINAETLQMHLCRGKHRNDVQKCFYILDEASQATTEMMHAFLTRLKETERALLTGDIGQHEGVGAGRPFAQLQEAGMHTARMEEIIRQMENPADLRAVKKLAEGREPEAMTDLAAQKSLHEIVDRNERIEAIASRYVPHAIDTLLVDPSNKSRQAVNEYIHCAMQDAGQVAKEEHTVRVLEQKNLTGSDRLYAQNYAYDDVLRFSKGSQHVGVRAGEYVQVSGIDHENNTLTVTRKSGEVLNYDPRRLQGVTAYRETEHAFAVGDRVQFTSRYHAEGVPNRAIGTVEEIDVDGNLRLRMRGTDREVQFNINQHPHLDYGYVMTSHSGQGQDFRRVLVHADTEQTPGKLLNETMAYVAISRGCVDVQVYTDDIGSLIQALSRDVSHSCALQQEPLMQESESLSLSAEGMVPEPGMEVGH